MPPPKFAVFPEIVELITFAIPPELFLIPPPELFAEFPEIVEFVTFSVPLFPIPPPYMAEFPEIVEFDTYSRAAVSNPAAVHGGVSRDGGVRHTEYAVISNSAGIYMAVFPEMVEFVTLAMPTIELTMPPPDLPRNFRRSSSR